MMSLLTSDWTKYRVWWYLQYWLSVRDYSLLFSLALFQHSRLLVVNSQLKKNKNIQIKMLTLFIYFFLKTFLSCYISMKQYSWKDKRSLLVDVTLVICVGSSMCLKWSLVMNREEGLYNPSQVYNLCLSWETTTPRFLRLTMQWRFPNV